MTLSFSCDKSIIREKFIWKEFTAVTLESWQRLFTTPRVLNSYLIFTLIITVKIDTRNLSQL